MPELLHLINIYMFLISQYWIYNRKYTYLIKYLYTIPKIINILHLNKK